MGCSVVSIKRLKEFYYGWVESRVECDMSLGIWEELNYVEFCLLCWVVSLK